VISLDNPVDGIVDLVKRRVKDPEFWDSSFSSDNYLKQYIAFHMLSGNAGWVTNDEGQITGAMIAYECEEEYARNVFIWKPPVGKTCIFVAQVVADDDESRDKLAHLFLQWFPNRKPCYGLRKGAFTAMNGHDIATKLIGRRTSNGRR